MQKKDKVTNCYSINVSNKFVSYEKIRKELKNNFQMMKRLIDTNPKFGDVSIIIGISNIDSRTAKIQYLYTYKKGRPKKEVVGNVVEWHFHIYAIKNGGSASVFCEEVKRHLIKKGYVVSKNKNDNVENAINYVIKQSICVWKYGNYFQSQNEK